MPMLILAMTVITTVNPRLARNRVQPRPCTTNCRKSRTRIIQYRMIRNRA